MRAKTIHGGLPHRVPTLGAGVFAHDFGGCGVPGCIDALSITAC